MATWTWLADRPTRKLTAEVLADRHGHPGVQAAPRRNELPRLMVTSFTSQGHRENVAIQGAVAGDQAEIWRRG